MVHKYGITLAATSSPERLSARLEAIFHGVHPEADAQFIPMLVGLVDRLFSGRDDRYNAIDMAYHNIEHTFQTALCLARMYAGRADVPGLAPLEPSDFRRALAAMLFHDTGYLKSRGDTQGTGAKYTFVHEQRSAELATAMLSEIGWPEKELDAIRLFILCTGPSSRPDRLPFRTPVDVELGAMVCTADFLGQMSDPNYLKKLPELFREFEEAYDVRGLKEEKRPFHSPRELLEKTPEFWRDFVLPKLIGECREVYRYLAVPPCSGENPYIRAVETHLASLSSGDVAA